MPSLPQLPEDASDAFKALQTLTGNSAHLKFVIAGQAYDAISFEGTEALSEVFSATLYVLADMDDMAGQTCASDPNRRLRQRTHLSWHRHLPT